MGDGKYGVFEHLDEDGAVFARAVVARAVVARAGIAEEEEVEAEQETKAQEEERVKEEDVPQRKEVEGSGDQRQGQAEVKRTVLRDRPRKVRRQALRSCRMVDSDVSESAEVGPDDELPMQSLQLVGKKRKAVEVEDELKPNLDVVKGKRLNEQGNIVDNEGDILAKPIEREAKAHPNPFRETAAGRAWERIPTRNTDTGPYFSGETTYEYCAASLNSATQKYDAQANMHVEGSWEELERERSPALDDVDKLVLQLTNIEESELHLAKAVEPMLTMP